MPSKSPKQHRLMELVAHDPKAAKRLGIPQAVAHEFVKSDQAKRKPVKVTVTRKL